MAFWSGLWLGLEGLAMHGTLTEEHDLKANMTGVRSEASLFESKIYGKCTDEASTATLTGIG